MVPTIPTDGHCCSGTSKCFVMFLVPCSFPSRARYRFITNPDNQPVSHPRLRDVATRINRFAGSWMLTGRTPLSFEIAFQYLWNVLPRVFQALLVSSSRLLAFSYSYSESCRKALRTFNSCPFRTPPHIHKRLLIVTYVADTDGV